MVQSSSVVKCLLCQASLNLSRGSLDKFKHHLEAAHESVFDLDLVISVSFLETEEKERIVETVFPRIKKFFTDMKNSSQDTRLGIEKRLMEDEELNGISALYRDNKRKRVEEDSKYSSLNESDELNSNSGRSKKIKDMENDLPSFGESRFSTNKLNDNGNDKDRESEDRAEDDNGDNEEGKSSERFQNPNESKCDICDKVMLKKSIRKHKQRVHQLYENLKNLNNSMGTGENSLFEDKENDVSMDNSMLEPQVDIEENPNVVSCEICHKSITKGNIKRHMDKIHFKSGPSNETIDEDEGSDSLQMDIPPQEQEQESKCKICFARFEELDELKEHFKDVHDIDYDNFENSEEDDVQIDNPKEEKVEEFPCDQCDAKYTIKDSLRRHRRTKHPC